MQKNNMPNPPKIFEVSYELRFKGVSRKFPEDEDTAQEKMIEFMIDATLKVIMMRYKTLGLIKKKNGTRKNIR